MNWNKLWTQLDNKELDGILKTNMQSQLMPNKRQLYRPKKQPKGHLKKGI